jgi:hypothetical protein
MMEPVTSGHIRAIGHDGTTLRVEFTNGAIHEYEHVAPEEFLKLKMAPSVGKYFHDQIKTKIQSRQVQPGKKVPYKWP